MSLKTIALGLVLIFVIIFTGVEYVEFAIIQSPSVNESVFRSIIYFLPILVGIPIALRVRGEGEEITEVRNSMDNPTVSCMGEGCWKRFTLDEATYAPMPNTNDITLVNVYRGCPFCGSVLTWIPPQVVKRDKWSRRLPAEVLQNIRENG